MASIWFKMAKIFRIQNNIMVTYIGGAASFPMNALRQSLASIRPSQ
jgi:hypothetical protein